MIRFATFLSPNVYPAYEILAREIGRSLGVPTELSVGSSLDQFASGEADVGFICGLPYVLLARAPEPPLELLAAPILAGERYRRKPIYFSDVIVRRDSGIASFSDLGGRSWCYNEPFSHSGYGLVRYRLIQMGRTGGFFGRVRAAGWHQESIKLVRRGEVDGSAIDSQVLEVELRSDPTLAEEIRVIETLGPSTIQPVVASARLDESLRQDLASALIEAGESLRDRLAEWGFWGFTPIEDSAYDDIREMLSAAEDAGFLKIA